MALSLRSLATRIAGGVPHGHPSRGDTVIGVLMLIALMAGLLTTPVHAGVVLAAVVALMVLRYRIARWSAWTGALDRIPPLVRLGAVAALTYLGSPHLRDAGVHQRLRDGDRRTPGGPGAVRASHSGAPAVRLECLEPKGSNVSRLRQVAAALLAVALAAVLPATAVADNCSGLTDCYGVLEAAALALLAMAILAFLVFNPGLLLAAASLLESMLFTPLGWLTGWGRGWGGAVAATGVEAGGAEAAIAGLRALGPQAFNRAAGTSNCFGVGDAVHAYLRTGVVNSALPAYGTTIEVGAALRGTSYASATFEWLSASLAASGPGSGGLVVVGNGVMGHAFNAYNINGAVIFADMQVTGIVSASASDVAAAAGYGILPRFVAFIGAPVV